MKPIDILGFFCAFCTLFAFFNVSHGRWQGQSYKYQLTNLLAGVVLAVYGYQKHAIASIFLNLSWCAIGLYGLYVISRKHPSKRLASKSKREDRHI